MSVPALNRVAVVGAGPAGAFFTLELSRRRPDIAVDLYDRDGRGPGAGIVMSREFADRMRAVHSEAFAVPDAAMASWDRTLTVVGDERIWSGAFGMFGLRRRAFHRHVRALAAGLPNVRLFRETVSSPPAEADLVVIADGASSRLRGARQDRFGTSITSGRTVFLWTSTPTVLRPSFFLKALRPGPLIVHAYPHGDDESTFIVEADPATLDAHGLRERSTPEIEKELSSLFSTELDGAHLRAQFPTWRSFTTVRNERWHDGRTVLLGDAAHTVHFSTGSGTVLAIEDALCLARALADTEATSLTEALDRYVGERRQVSDTAQAEATDSVLWFERLSRRERLHGHQTVFALRSRRQVNTYDKLRTRDPEFVARAVERVAGRPTDAEPLDLPITVGGVELTSRLVRAGRREAGHVVLCFATATGDMECETTGAGAVPLSGRESAKGPRAGDPPGMAECVAPCVLLREPPTAELVAALRAAGASVLGLFVTPARRQIPPLPDIDFLAVPSQPGPGRVTRTDLADELRYATGLPVLLLSEEHLSRTEINTLITAGRADMVALVRADALSGNADGDGEG